MANSSRSRWLLTSPHHGPCHIRIGLHSPDPHACACRPVDMQPLLPLGQQRVEAPASLKLGVAHAVLVMCDVRNPDSTPHATNTRAGLVDLLTPDVVAEKPMYGFEQVPCPINPAPLPRPPVTSLSAWRPIGSCGEQH